MRVAPHHIRIHNVKAGITQILDMKLKTKFTVRTKLILGSKCFEITENPKKHKINQVSFASCMKESRELLNIHRVVIAVPAPGEKSQIRLEILHLAKSQTRWVVCLPSWHSQRDIFEPISPYLDNPPRAQASRSPKPDPKSQP